MNIVMTTDTYWPRINGVAISIDSFKNQFNLLGYHTHLFAPDYPMTDEQRKRYDDETIHRVKTIQLFFSKEDWLTLPTEAKNVFNRIKNKRKFLHEKFKNHRK